LCFRQSELFVRYIYFALLETMTASTSMYGSAGSMGSGGKENNISNNSEAAPLLIASAKGSDFVGNDKRREEINFFSVLLPLAFIGLIDSISFMIVAPSLAFYVIHTMGGSKELYGLILSTFSFASFLFKPILGQWCDINGSKFRIPYCVSISAAAAGGLLYFLASAFAVQTVEDGAPSSNDLIENDGSANASSYKMNYIGVVLIVLGRFLGGMGAANSTLGFTYIALVVPHTQMTKASSILSTVRIIGMAVGPLFSVILAKIQFSVTIFGTEINVTQLNSVGLVLFIGNMLGLFVLYSKLKEPSEVLEKFNLTEETADISEVSSDNNTKELHHEQSSVIEDKNEFWRNVFTFDVMIPIFIIFALNANFQLIETALAPAANDALGWGTVEVSSVFSLNAMLMFAVILTTYQLSGMGIKDGTFLIVGEMLSLIAYFLLYVLWKQHAAVWHFILPLVLGISCFPLLGAPSRSVYTEIIASKPVLMNHQGTMQAYMSMSASVAGFVAPGFIASYVLRTPDAVSASVDQRELTLWALLAPFFSLLSLLGVLWLRRIEQREKVESLKLVETNKIVESSDIPRDDYKQQNMSFVFDQNDNIIEESSGRGKQCQRVSRNIGEVIVPLKFKPRTQACRHETTTLMGIHQISFLEHRSSTITAPNNTSRRIESDIRQSTRF
jgi:MFS transporter, ceroid-lipofuscinosis neuronal protein 7